MTLNQALEWLLAHNCVIDTDPRAHTVIVKVYNGGVYPIRAQNNSVDMQYGLIECVKALSTVFTENKDGTYTRYG